MTTYISYDGIWRNGSKKVRLVADDGETATQLHGRRWREVDEPVGEVIFNYAWLCTRSFGTRKTATRHGVLVFSTIHDGRPE